MKLPAPLARSSGFATPLDAAILAQALRGDPAAMESIYRLYAQPAFGLALRMLGRSATAEDAVHDAFVRALESLGSYRGDAPFGAWLKRLVANVAIDRLRSDQRWRPSEDALDALEAAPEPLAAEALGLLARLPARARSVVWLHAMEGFSHAEIGSRFGQTEGWSKSTLSRSLARLRELGMMDQDSRPAVESAPPRPL